MAELKINQGDFTINGQSGNKVESAFFFPFLPGTKEGSNYKTAL